MKIRATNAANKDTWLMFHKKDVIIDQCYHIGWKIINQRMFWCSEECQKICIQFTFWQSRPWSWTTMGKNLNLQQKTVKQHVSLLWNIFSWKQNLACQKTSMFGKVSWQGGKVKLVWKIIWNSNLAACWVAHKGYGGVVKVWSATELIFVETFATPATMQNLANCKYLDHFYTH